MVGRQGGPRAGQDRFEASALCCVMLVQVRGLIASLSLSLSLSLTALQLRVTRAQEAEKAEQAEEVRRTA